MTNDEQIESTMRLFQDLIQREAVSAPAHAPAAAAGPAPARRISTPHPWYVVSGTAVVQGKFGDAAQLAGYQSLVLEDEDPVEVLLAAPSGDTMTYTAAWPASAARAFTTALQVAEDHGINDDFATVTVPEAGLIALWFRERRELIPLALGEEQGAQALEPEHVYQETDVIERLRGPLQARFSMMQAASLGETTPTPPRG